MLPRNGVAILVVACGVAASALAQQGERPDGAPAQPAPAAPASGEFSTAEELLAALERADEKLESLTADIRYDRTFELQGDRQVRTGKLYFVSGRTHSGEGAPGPAGAATPTGGRKFSVEFKRLQVGEVVREEPKVYIFDGRWLVEKFPKERPPLFIKREVVPPGEKFDPLKIGEGPFPLPIGQKREDIARRFDVALLPPGAGLEPGDEATEEERATAANLRDFVAGASHIRLTPKPAFAEEEEFTEVHLWYRRDAAGQFLPRMARTIDKGLNTSVVQLINVEVQREGGARNAGATVPAEVLDTTQPPAGSGWEVQVQPWSKPAGAAPRPRREGPEAGDP